MSHLIRRVKWHDARSEQLVEESAAYEDKASRGLRVAGDDPVRFAESP